VSSQPVRTRTIGGAAQLLLRQTGDLVELIAGNIVLLSSAALATERDFGRLAATLGASRPARRVVIGGLGFGATLRGVLEIAPPDARVTVVEKVDAVVELVRGELAYISKDTLADPRVELVRGDVGAVVARRTELDAVLLDVDNGPHWASFRSNARLYTHEGLLALKKSLAKGGALAVWSGYRADGFLATLRRAGLEPSIVTLKENGRTRARAYIGTL
jgi:spermidine synthase